MSSPKTWSLTCCKKWTWRRDASKFGELILWVACSTKTLLSTRVKAFHIFPHTVASNVVFCQKYVLSEKDCLCPVIIKIVHKDLMPQNFGNIIFHLQYKTLISNISETHRFSPQMRLIAYPDHKTTLTRIVNVGCIVEYRDFTREKIQTHRNVMKGQKVTVSNDGFRSCLGLRCVYDALKSLWNRPLICMLYATAPEVDVAKLNWVLPTSSASQVRNHLRAMKEDATEPSPLSIVSKAIAKVIVKTKQHRPQDMIRNRQHQTR